ncbi:unnamed protein product [Amoebophrya sp. A25]|nr:unnamed protein product [Amoebophrya sp. A25]|eukprot:GSA25T00017205001.1
MKSATHDCMHALRRAWPDSENEAEKRKFELIIDHKFPHGVSFIRCSGDKKPTELATGLLERFAQGQEKSLALTRVLPCDFLVEPTLEAFRALAEKEIKPVFADKTKVLTWALQFKTRGVKKLTKDAILKVIDQWSDGHPVSIDKPDVCINVEVNPLFMGVGLLAKWEKYHKYNVQSIMNPDAAKKEAEAHRVRGTAKAGKEGETKKETEAKKEAETKAPAAEKAAATEPAAKADAQAAGA